MEQEGAGPSFRVADAEGRLATVVKCDIVDSTRIWNRLDRTERLELTRDFRRAVEAVRERHNGYLERWEGDGALITFGYPEPRVDAAEAAVRAGLELVEAMQSVRAVPRVELQLRVGIATGQVTIDLTNDSLEGMLFNKAERLKTLAQPGRVVIGDDTRDIVKNFFEYEDLGTQELKGFDESVRAWCVVRGSSVESRFAARGGTHGGIVGRDGAQKALLEAWADALAGRGKAVCLVGEPGIGKSRLAQAVLEEGREKNEAITLEIDCTPSTGNSPLFPVGVLLRRIARISTGASQVEKEDLAKTLLARYLDPEGVHEVLAYLAPLFGIETGPIPLDKTREQVRNETIAVIVRVLRALAARQPLVLLCEDLHWADDTTAQLLHDFTECVGELRALLIVTRWPKADTAIDLERFTAKCATVQLDALPATDAVKLVRSVAGAAELPDDRVREIVGRCGGVPLLLEEVTRNALESAGGAGASRTTRSEGSTVLPELQFVVESRLGRKSEFKEIVQAAAVLGREFPTRLLERMLPDRKTEVTGALSHFADHGLFSSPGSVATDRAGFRHAMIRDAVYETLIGGHLQALHSRAADMLMEGYQGTPDASPDVLAQHLRKAGRRDEAIDIRLVAGEDTFKRGAYVESQGHCEAASELIEEVGESAKRSRKSFRLWVQLGMVRTGLQGYSADPAKIAYQEAQGMFDEGTGPDLRYPVIRGLATYYLVRGELATAYRYSEQGLQLAEQSNRPDYRIDAMSVLCYTSLYFKDKGLEDCRSWIERCLKLYDEAGGDRFRYPVPQDAATAALALAPTVAWLLGDPQGAEDAIRRGEKHVNDLGRDFDKALLCCWVAGVRYTQRRHLEAAQKAQEAVAISMQHGFGEWLATGAMLGLLAQAALGPAPEALAKLGEYFLAFQARGVGLNASYYLWGLARGLVNVGMTDAANEKLQMALGIAHHSEESRMNAELHILQAELEPDRAKALGLLAKALEVAEEQGAVANALRAAATIVLRAGSDAGDRERAQAALDLLNGVTNADGEPRWMHERLAENAQTAKALLAAG